MYIIASISCLQINYVKAEAQTFDLQGITTDAGSGAFQMDINIGTLVFTAHPLFTAEDTAAAQLVALCTGADQRRDSKATAGLEGRLAALREAVQLVQQQLRATAEVSSGSIIKAHFITMRASI